MTTEFCDRCQQVQPSHVVQHASGTEWLCKVCGWQTDFMVNEEDDEPEDWDEEDQP